MARGTSLLWVDASNPYLARIPLYRHAGHRSAHVEAEEPKGNRIREFVVECEVVRIGDGLESAVAEGVEQTTGDMARHASGAGHPVVIDRREGRCREEKAYHRSRRSKDGVRVDIRGM